MVEEPHLDTLRAADMFDMSLGDIGRSSYPEAAQPILALTDRTSLGYSKLSKYRVSCSERNRPLEDLFLTQILLIFYHSPCILN